MYINVHLHKHLRTLRIHCVRTRTRAHTAHTAHILAHTVHIQVYVTNVIIYRYIT